MYDPAWDKSDDIPESQNEVSAVVEVLEEEESNAENEERWNSAYFGEMPRQVDANGNPTIFWDESIEPPEPDDFELLQEYEEAWQKWEQENSDNSICAAELERDSLSVESSREELSYADCVKSTSFVNIDCAITSPTSQSIIVANCKHKHFKPQTSRF